MVDEKNKKLYNNSLSIGKLFIKTIPVPWYGLSPPKKSLKTFSEFPWNVYPCVHAPVSPLPSGTPFFSPSSPNWS